MVRNETVVAIGEYDGFHLGHADLVQTAYQLARASGRASVAVVVDALDGLPKLLPIERRCVLAMQGGADWAVVVGATRPGDGDDLAERVSDLVHDELGARLAVLACAPEDGRPVRWPALRPALARRGLDVFEVARLQRAGVPLTSGSVTAAIEAGDVRGAAEMLGRPVEMDGVVERGAQLGRQFGFPTANVAPAPGRVWAAYGVYAGYVVLPGGHRQAATVNIGVRPTVTGGGRPLVEAHLLDFDGDLYGSWLRVELVQRLRSEQRFDSIGALVDQIAKDVAASRDVLAGNSASGLP